MSIHSVGKCAHAIENILGTTAATGALRYVVTQSEFGGASKPVCCSRTCSKINSCTTEPFAAGGLRKHLPHKSISFFNGTDCFADHRILKPWRQTNWVMSGSNQRPVLIWPLHSLPVCIVRVQRQLSGDWSPDQAESYSDYIRVTRNIKRL